MDIVSDADFKGEPLENLEMNEVIYGTVINMCVKYYSCYHYNIQILYHQVGV